MIEEVHPPLAPLEVVAPVADRPDLLSALLSAGEFQSHLGRLYLHNIGSVPVYWSYSASAPLVGAMDQLDEGQSITLLFSRKYANSVYVAGLGGTGSLAVLQST